MLTRYSFSQDGGGKYKGKHQVLTSTATITINLIDAQDMPPSFVGTPYFGYVYEVSVPVSLLLLLYSCKVDLVNIHKINYRFFFCQGSEIFTVYAKDGDQGKPNMMHYSIMNGKNDLSRYKHLVYCFQPFYQTHLKHLLYHVSGSDGVFDINSTSGCITLTTYPFLLRNELYEIKVKVIPFISNESHSSGLNLTHCSYFMC